MTLLCILFFLLLRLSIAAAGSNIKRQNQQQSSVYDYVVVGCGATGLVIASRLSELANTSVLCLEAGQIDHDEQEITNPYYIGLQPAGFYDWQIFTTPQVQLDGARRHIPMGKGVGGGTLINGMVWNRGNQQSFDSWATLGNPGWSWTDLLPYFIRSETFTPKTYQDQDIPPTRFDPAVHGATGPVQVSYPNYFWEQSSESRPRIEVIHTNNSNDNWFEALQSLGIPVAADPNRGLSAGGYFLPSNIDPNNQTRSDARRTYYRAAEARSNLLVMPNSQVTRILFNNSGTLHATGVEYAQGPGLPRMTAQARQEVILAAGAIHTPQLLELSGIGPADVLRQYGIPVLEDLPGVGNNLQDHGLIHLNYLYTNRSLISVNDFASNQTFNNECANEYATNRSGPWTAKPLQAVAFPSLGQISPVANALLRVAFINAGSYLPSTYETTLRNGYSQQLASIIAELKSDNIPAAEILNNNGGGLDVALMRPLSRGTCHITSADPFTAPAVDPRWLAHPFDQQVMISAMLFNQRLLETPALASMQPTYVDVPHDASPDQLAAILRQRIGTEYHYSGTAAMLPRNVGGVVDSNLLVYGTDNLRVVDTSIYPIVPGAHLQSVAYAVAERAADLIRGSAGNNQEEENRDLVRGTNSSATTATGLAGGAGGPRGFQSRAGRVLAPSISKSSASFFCFCFSFLWFLA